jgi:hypothetical protein
MSFNGSLGFVYAVTVYDDGIGPALYASGGFDAAGGVPAKRIAKWDGASWLPLGAGMSSNVHALTDFNDGGGAKLYAGGEFTIAGETGATIIAGWDGATWSPLGVGLSADQPRCQRYCFDDGGGLALYAGGAFITAGNPGHSTSRSAMGPPVGRRRRDERDGTREYLR